MLLAAAPASAVDPCEEARWAGDEIIAHQKALLVILEMRNEHCKKPEKHPACGSFEAVSAALEGAIDRLSAIRALRKRECG
jgi:hypothetical protein